jgi:CheY-like chemotaxis protein
VSKPKVLIVEDEVIIAWSLRRMLESLESEVVSIAANADKAVEEARAAAPDLILMDIALKGKKTGIDAAMEIRRFSRVPIIFLTGNTHLVDDPSITATEAQGMYAKPPTGAQLLEMLAIAREGKA